MVKLLMTDGEWYIPSDGELFISVKQNGKDEYYFFRRAYPTGTIVQYIKESDYLTNKTPFSSPPDRQANLNGRSAVWEKWTPDMKGVALEDYL